MKILLLSDTHSHIDDRILHYAEQADEVWHAGDIGSFEVTDALSKKAKLRAVYGNIDDAKMRAHFPSDQHFCIEGVSVWMTHIGGYPPQYNAKTRATLLQNPPDLFICGHSHILKVIPDKLNGLLHMNPGACGTHGFHKVRTMLRFEILNGKIENLEVVELGDKTLKCS